jgi:hypothetical protein
LLIKYHHEKLTTPASGQIILLDSVNNKFNNREFDHIVEGGVKVESGQFDVLDCPNSKVQFEIKVKPGTYRIRIYSSNLDSVEGDDYYKIEIWPSDNLQRKVLKRYTSK